jgi:hypothetical protein
LVCLCKQAKWSQEFSQKITKLTGAGKAMHRVKRSGQIIRL